MRRILSLSVSCTLLISQNAADNRVKRSSAQENWELDNEVCELLYWDVLEREMNFSWEIFFLKKF